MSELSDVKEDLLNPKRIYSKDRLESDNSQLKDHVTQFTHECVTKYNGRVEYKRKADGSFEWIVCIDDNN
jgi:hypothetical protein